METRRFYFAGGLLLIKKAFHVMVMASLAVLSAPTEILCQTDCRVFLYKNDNRHQAIENFAPHDKIHIHVDFDRLPKGRYAFQAEWYNAFGELQDTSHYTF